MSATEMVLFESSDGVVTLPVEVDVAHEEVWLTRHQMSELFGRDIKTIGKHVNNALRAELSGSKERVGAKFATTAADGNTYPVEHSGIGVLSSKTGVDVSYARSEGVVFLHTKKIGLVAEAHASNDLTALLVGEDVRFSRSIGTQDGLMVVVVEQIECAGIALYDVEHLAD